MRILICSDGMDPADKPVLLAGLVAVPTKAETTLLGITETPADEKPLREALENEAEKLRRYGVSPEIETRAGEPIREILEQTKSARYDMTIIGARRKTSSGPYWRSGKTYEVIKAIPTPVLLATGICETLKSFIVCTGGKKYIDAAVELTGKLAAAVGASVTLLHVMAEPPAIYADLGALFVPGLHDTGMAAWVEPLPDDVEQLQALLTLAWSALLLREHVTRVTVLAAVAVIVCVVWAQRARVPTEAAPQE